MSRAPDDAELARRLRAAIRDIPDFPSAGILFKDITPVLADPALFARAVDAMAAPFAALGIDCVAAIESRGFLFGAPVARALGAGVVPLRKPGKLPYRTVREDYDLEYGTDALEMHIDAVAPGQRMLVVDDVLATGGTAAAACRLIERAGGVVAGCSVLVALAFLPGPERLADRNLKALVTFGGDAA